jgi:hypothetical protein
MFPAVATRVPRQRTAAATVLSVALLLGSVLAGCEYADEDDHWDDDVPTASAPPSTRAARPQDPALNRPVTGAELDEWVKQALPPAEGEVFHTGYGSLEADVERTEPTGQLPSGTYALALACRSTSRVSFTVRNGETSLVDLSLWCGTSRVNVVSLPADAVLTVEVEGKAPSNFAYSVTRL